MKGNGIPRVLPALILQTGLHIPPVVLDISITVAITPFVDPAKSRARRVLHLLDQLLVTAPALVLVEENEEQGRRVGGAEVRGMGALLEGGQLAPSNLMEN